LFRGRRLIHPDRTGNRLPAATRARTSRRAAGDDVARALEQFAPAVGGRVAELRFGLDRWLYERLVAAPLDNTYIP
jgi:hypothetical protein